MPKSKVRKKKPSPKSAPRRAGSGYRPRYVYREVEAEAREELGTDGYEYARRREEENVVVEQQVDRILAPRGWKFRDEVWLWPASQIPDLPADWDSDEYATATQVWVYECYVHVFRPGSYKFENSPMYKSVAELIDNLPEIESWRADT